MNIKVTHCEDCPFSGHKDGEQEPIEFCIALNSTIDIAPYENTPSDCPLLKSEMVVKLIP